MNDELDELTKKYTQAEKEEAKPDKPESEPEALTVEPSEDAGNVAAFAVSTLGGVLRLFEPRIDLSQEEAEAREACGPAVEKYQLHRGGAGEAFAYKPEVSLGLYLGRLIKSVVGQFKLWKEHDKDGEKREHPPQEQSHAVPRDNGARKESVLDASGEHSDPSSAGDLLGHEQGSSALPR